MKIIKRKIYTIYRKCQHNWIVATIASFLYVRLVGLIKRRNAIRKPEITGLKGPKIAFVCDEMTWQDFGKECRGIFVTPSNWLKIFKDSKPEIFFCESAWSGIEVYKDCWRGQLYKSDNIYYENRKNILNILNYCKKNKIPTIFWNKEDPTFFSNKYYNFVDTALHFDIIFTTAQECIPKYQELGHNLVYNLMFGFSPELFYPPKTSQRKNIAVFAGSWFADQPERCRDMIEVFDFVQSKGIELVIYNRQSDSSNPNNRFPAKYNHCLRPKIPFNQLGEIFRTTKYAININTVKHSETMFARRVFEVIACGCIVISNESNGLRNIFHNRIWFVNEDFNNQLEGEISLRNMADVFENHTCESRMQQILRTIKENK